VDRHTDLEAVRRIDPEGGLHIRLVEDRHIDQAVARRTDRVEGHHTGLKEDRRTGPAEDHRIDLVEGLRSRLEVLAGILTYMDQAVGAVRCSFGLVVVEKSHRSNPRSHRSLWLQVGVPLLGVLARKRYNSFRDHRLYRS
jgi:hypothetical protein